MANKEISIIIIILLVFVFAYFTLPFVLIGLDNASKPNPPEPEITYGEFPFKLVYEISGEQKVIEDTVICEYDGIGIGSGSKYRKWKSRLASGNKEVILLRIDNKKHIYYLVGSPSYYMGDMRKNTTWEHFFPDAFLHDAKGFGMNDKIKADELLSEYGIKLISWEPSPPIVNSFR